MSSRSIYLYTQLSVAQLNELLTSFQDYFENYLKDNFEEDELSLFEKYLDTMAEVVVQPILGELSFDDFYPDPQSEDEQRSFFTGSRSCLCLDHLPFLESNPFQVTYLKELLSRLGEVLIDQGGVSELTFKERYLAGLGKLKSADALVPPEPIKAREPKVSGKAPVNPIDFLILDVYREFERIKSANLLMAALSGLQDKSEKLKKIFFVMREEKLDADALLSKTGLGAKDFDDNLEKLKFYLKKIL